MNKQDIKRALQNGSSAKGFITAKEFSQVMGIKTADHAKKKYLNGLERISGKYYLIEDVADKLKSCKEV